MSIQPFQPVLRTQADVESFWRRICHPLGWTRHDLWFAMIGADGRPLPILHDVRDRPVEVDPSAVRSLVELWRRLEAEHAPGGRIAVLLCRPGAEAIQASDRLWARAIATEAATLGVALEVIHVASDEAIRPLVLDDAA
ncbi:hypothetical protein JCM18899A_06210 [Nocardioides sp. AN3]